MENIFNEAKFGDKFKTRDGRCAVLVDWGEIGGKQLVYLYIQEKKDIEPYGLYTYYLDGSAHGFSQVDIIGKWED